MDCGLWFVICDLRFVICDWFLVRQSGKKENAAQSFFPFFFFFFFFPFLLFASPLWDALSFRAVAACCIFIFSKRATLRFAFFAFGAIPWNL